MVVTLSAILSDVMESDWKLFAAIATTGYFVSLPTSDGMTSSPSSVPLTPVSVALDELSV